LEQPVIHPDTELRPVSPEIGLGVFATRPIARGTIVWVKDDLDVVLSPQRVAALDDARRATVLEYAFRDQRGDYVLCWDLGRYVNHSFHPTCIATAWDLEVAGRDIAPGEQLTDDYGSLNLDEPFDCVPEEGTDRRQALPGDVLRYADHWDALALAALADYDRVAQPLARYVTPGFVPRLRAAVEGGVLLDSVRATYYDPTPAA
jgi:hypothetical protein